MEYLTEVVQYGCTGLTTFSGSTTSTGSFTFLLHSGWFQDGKKAYCGAGFFNHTYLEWKDGVWYLTKNGTTTQRKPGETVEIEPVETTDPEITSVFQFGKGAVFTSKTRNEVTFGLEHTNRRTVQCNGPDHMCAESTPDCDQVVSAPTMPEHVRCERKPQKQSFLVYVVLACVSALILGFVTCAS